MTDWNTLTSTAPADKDFLNLAQQPCLMPLDKLSAISVAGPEAEAFLQNLVTNHVADLNDNQAQYNGLCNPKGRLLATFILVRVNAEQFYLLLSADLCDSITKRLTMYVLRSKVTVTNCAESHHCVGLTQQLPSPINALTNDYDVVVEGATYFIKVPADKGSRYLVLNPAETSSKNCDTWLKANYQLMTPDYWYWLDIQAGLAHVVAETVEQFTPQQINLDLNHGVSFNKGCYPGQEVVARLHYLGKPSRRLFIATANTTVSPNAGSEVNSTPDHVAGHIVSACQHLGQLDCLISLKLNDLDASLHLDESTPLVITSELPQEV